MGYNLDTDFGADGTGVTDCSAAFQAAIDAMATLKGGKITGTPGSVYKLTHSVTKTLGTDVFYQLEIDGCGSTIHVACASTDRVISLAGYGTLHIHGFTAHSSRLIDTPECDEFLSIGGVLNLHINDMNLVGVSATTSVVHVHSCGTTMHSMRFGGSGSSANPGVLRITSSLYFNLTGCSFIDYGGFDGEVYAKPINVPHAWIQMEDDNPSYTGCLYRISNCHFDESGLRAIRMIPASSTCAGLTVTNCTAYKNRIGSVGCFASVTNCNNVEFLNCRTHNLNDGNPVVIELFNVANCTIDKLAAEMSYDVNIFGNITADSSCGYLEIIDSDVNLVLSQAAVTTVKQGPLTSRVVTCDDYVFSNTLVKPSDIHAGHVKHLAPGDSGALACGVSLEETIYGYGHIVFPARATYTDVELMFRVRDGFGGALIEFYAGLTGSGSGPNWIKIDLSTAVTGADVAAAVSAAVNTYGSGLQVTTTVAGDTVYFVDNHWGTPAQDQSFQNGVAAQHIYGIYAGRSTVKMVELHGQPTFIRSDGSSALTVGDTLVPSSTSPGRIMKAASTGALGWRATTSCPAAADALVGIVWSSASPSADVLAKVVDTDIMFKNIGAGTHTIGVMPSSSGINGDNLQLLAGSSGVNANGGSLGLIAGDGNGDYHAYHPGDVIIDCGNGVVEGPSVHGGTAGSGNIQMGTNFCGQVTLGNDDGDTFVLSSLHAQHDLTAQDGAISQRRSVYPVDIIPHEIGTVTGCKNKIACDTTAGSLTLGLENEIGREYTIFDATGACAPASCITVLPPSGSTINGSSSLVLDTAHASRTVLCVSSTSYVLVASNGL